MSKQVYLDANAKSGDIALEYVLGNSNTSDAAIKQAIGTVTGGSYQQAGITLSRQHKAQVDKGDTAGAEATADAMAYFSMKQKIEHARASDHPTSLEVYSYQSLKEGAVSAGNWNRISDDSRIRIEEHKARVAETARVEAARVAALSPRDKAIEDVVGEADRAAVRKTLHDLNGKGRSIDEVRVNIHNNLEDRAASWFDGHDSRKLALKVLDRQEEIQRGGGTSSGIPLVTSAAAATPAPHAPAPAAPATPAAAAHPAEPAHPAAPAPAATPASASTATTPRATVAHRSWTPIEKQVQYDLEVIGKPTGQKPNWTIAQGADKMDGKNGPKTGASLDAWKKENNVTEMNADAIKLLHTQALAKAAAAQAAAAGTTPGQQATTPSGPAAAPAVTAATPAAQRH